MRHEASLRRLEEMGIDVYLPRDARGVGAASSPAIAEARAADETTLRPAAAAANVTPAAVASSTKEVAGTSPRGADVLLLADMSAATEPLLAAVTRTLAFARVTCARASADDANALATATARALVAFGEAQARAAGAALSAQRQSQIGWVVAAEVARLRGDALGKRALWGELKRVVRLLRAPAR